MKSKKMETTNKNKRQVKKISNKKAALILGLIALISTLLGLGFGVLIGVLTQWLL